VQNIKKTGTQWGKNNFTKSLYVNKKLTNNEYIKCKFLGFFGKCYPVSKKLDNLRL